MARGIFKISGLGSSFGSIYQRDSCEDAKDTWEDAGGATSSKECRKMVGSAYSALKKATILVRRGGRRQWALTSLVQVSERQCENDGQTAGVRVGRPGAGAGSGTSDQGGLRQFPVTLPRGSRERLPLAAAADANVPMTVTAAHCSSNTHTRYAECCRFLLRFPIRLGADP